MLSTPKRNPSPRLWAFFFLNSQTLEVDSLFLQTQAKTTIWLNFYYRHKIVINHCFNASAFNEQGKYNEALSISNRYRSGSINPLF